MSDLIPLPDPADDEESAKNMQLLEEWAAKIEGPARRLGLYYQGAMLQDIPVHDVVFGHTTQKGMVMAFTVGDLAWSDRVQNPEQEEFDKDFRKLDTEMERDHFDDLRTRFERLRDSGGSILDALGTSEDDDDGDAS